MKSNIGMIAALAGMMANNGLNARAIEAAMPKLKMPKVSKKYKRMITSTDAEIAAWNKACSTRQVLRREARNSSYSR